MQNLPDQIRDLKQTSQNLKREMAKAIIGQDEVITHLLTALFAGGHVLIEGVPGLAKTLMISGLAQCLSLSFSRIQFTPDLMPSDITGTDILVSNQTTGTKSFEYLKGQSLPI